MHQNSKNQNYKNIVVTGTIAFDHIMNLPTRFRDYIMPDKIHMLNVSFQADKMRKEMGGTGGNIAYGLGLLEMNPILLATAGNGFKVYQEKLKMAGVDCSRVKIYKNELCSTGFCITDPDDNQIWSFSFNASRNTCCLKIPKNKKSFVVISPSGPAGVMHFVDLCIKLKLPYLFDPAFNIPDLTKIQLKKGIKEAKIVIGNDYEIELMKRKTAMTIEDILKNGQVLITTLGSKGSKIQIKTNDSKLKTIVVPPAKPKDIIDPTGAGDAFRAGFLAGFLRDLPLEVCGKMGSLSSIYTVEKYGTVTHKFTLKQFERRYKQNFGKKLEIYTHLPRCSSGQPCGQYTTTIFEKN